MTEQLLYSQLKSLLKQYGSDQLREALESAIQSVEDDEEWERERIMEHRMLHGCDDYS